MRILLVRLRLIGDVVFTTPAVAALRARYPDAHLAYLVEPASAPVVATNPHLDEVIVTPRGHGLRGTLADLSLGRRLRESHYDVAIDFHGGPRASLLTWLSRAPVRVGYHVAARSWMYTRVVDRPRTLRLRHSVENQWDLLASLDIPPPNRAANPLEMAADPVAAATVDARLAAAGVEAHDDIAILHVSASSPFRTWPLDSFIDTAVALASRPARRIVVTSGPSDRDAATRVIAAARDRLPESERCSILEWSDFSLAELRALAARSAVYVGGDSGPLHIAATTAVPIVAIFGPTPSERSAPWRSSVFPTELMEVSGLPCRPCDQRVCEPGDFRCLTRTTASHVIAAAERVMAARADAQPQDPV